MMRTLAITLVSIMIMSGCSKSQKQSRMIHQAIMIHNSMILKANEIEHDLHELASDTSFIQLQDSIRFAKDMLDSWKRELVEVPGNEAHEHTDHDHSHQSIDVTDEQMLAIQKELDSKLSYIGKTVQRIKSIKQNK